ncbi:MAG: hypothetical protein WBM76_09725 [Woeseiaceae bacterium]
MRRYFNMPEVLVFLASIWIALTCNIGYWRIVMQNSPAGHWSAFSYGISFLFLTVGLIALILLILSSFVGTRILLNETRGRTE